MITVTYEFKDQAELEAFVLRATENIPGTTPFTIYGPSPVVEMARQAQVFNAAAAAIETHGAEAVAYKSGEFTTAPKKKGRGPAKKKAEPEPIVEGPQMTATEVRERTQNVGLPGRTLEQIEAPAPAYTLDDVQAAIIELNEKKGMSAVNALLRTSNIARLKDVPVEAYPQLIKDCKAAAK